MASSLHPQAQEFLRNALAAGNPRLHDMTPAQAREMSAGMGEAIGPGPDVERVEDLTIPVDGAEIAARRYVPAGARGTFVWLHGGGFVLDGLDAQDAMCRILADSSRTTVYNIDYRVAPEHVFPTAVEDCWAALRWIADSLDADGRPLVVGGDSAGGNLAAVCALRARDAGGPALAAQVLVYPVVDWDMTNASYREHGANEGLLLDARAMRWFADHYLPEGADREHPDAAPLRAPDVSGLPPAIVVIAEHDPLRDEGLAYAERLRDAGVPVSLHHYEDMPHVFFSFVNLMQTGNAAVARVGAEIRDLVGRGAAATA